MVLMVITVLLSLRTTELQVVVKKDTFTKILISYSDVRYLIVAE